MEWLCTGVLLQKHLAQEYHVQLMYSLQELANLGFVGGEKSGGAQIKLISGVIVTDPDNTTRLTTAQPAQHRYGRRAFDDEIDGMEVKFKSEYGQEVVDNIKTKLKTGYGFARCAFNYAKAINAKRDALGLEMVCKEKDEHDVLTHQANLIKKWLKRVLLCFPWSICVYNLRLICLMPRSTPIDPGVNPDFNPDPVPDPDF
uniref:Uncharacterized protein n=1 Tax=Plectus sambesii TaxID=2011161 RepID=A0A914UPG3_9BILA